MSQTISTSRDGLTRAFAGKKLSARQLNALIDLAVTRNPVEPGTITDQFGQHRRMGVKVRPSWVRIKSDIDMDAFGIAEVYDGSFKEGEFFYKVRTPTETGRVFIANEDYPLFAGAEGWARLITHGDPVQVRANAALNFMDIANPIVGDDQIQQARAGSMFIVSSSETASGTFKTGVTLLAGAPGLVGKTTGAVSQGSFGLVNLYRPSIGVVVNSWSDLTYGGEQQDALFLFGAAPSTPAWVGLIDNAWAWTAYVIECVGS